MHNPFGDRSAAEIWELVKEWLWRIFAPRAYADLRIKELEARCAALEALGITGNT